MSSLIPMSRPSIGIAAVAVMRRVTAPIQALAKAFNNRREVAMLLHADPGMLRDLGLSQTDLACALAEPMWRDPSSRLLVWATERRAAARASARDNIKGLAAGALRPSGKAPTFSDTAPALSGV